MKLAGLERKRALFAKLQPFEELVADDIEGARTDEPELDER